MDEDKAQDGEEAEVQNEDVGRDLLLSLRILHVFVDCFCDLFADCFK